MQTYDENKMELNYLNEYDGLKIGDHITYSKRYNPIAEECLKAYLKTLNLKITYAEPEQSADGFILFITGPYRNRDLHRSFYRLHIFNPLEKDLQNLDMYADERLKIWNIDKFPDNDSCEIKCKDVYEFIKYLIDQEMNLLGEIVKIIYQMKEDVYDLFPDVERIIYQITDVTKFYLDYLNMNGYDKLSLKYTLIDGIHRINSICKNKFKNKFDEYSSLNSYNSIKMMYSLYFNIKFYMPIYKL